MKKIISPSGRKQPADSGARFSMLGVQQEALAAHLSRGNALRFADELRRSTPQRERSTKQIAPARAKHRRAERAVSGQGLERERLQAWIWPCEPNGGRFRSHAPVVKGRGRCRGSKRDETHGQRRARSQYLPLECVLVSLDQRTGPSRGDGVRSTVPRARVGRGYPRTACTRRILRQASKPPALTWLHWPRSSTPRRCLQ